jgi:ribose/xylose/arabinose/galactoside ABC-type transport system permease subunit
MTTPTSTGPGLDADAGAAGSAAARGRGRVPAAFQRVAMTYGLPVVLLLMVVVFAVQQPRMLSVGNVVNVTRSAADLAILATGQAFVLLLGHVDISVGSIVGASSVMTAWAVLQIGMLGMAAGTLFGAFIGFLNGYLVARFRVHSVIVTIGMLTALRGWTLWVTNGQPIFAGLPPSYLTLGAGFIGPFPLPAVIAALVLTAAALFLRYTRFGPSMYAVGGNEEAAHLAGIPVFRYKLLAFVATGALAGLAVTILSSRTNSGQPNLGQMMELDAIAAAVIGGMALTGGRGSIGGVALGVATLALLRNGLNLTNVSSFAQMMITGLVIIAAVIADRLRQRNQ